MTFAEFQKARRVLGLGERTTLKEIKSRHRALIKCHHPDTGNTEDPEVIRDVNAAYPQRDSIRGVTAAQF